MMPEQPCLVHHVFEWSIRSTEPQERGSLSIDTIEDAYTRYQEALAELTAHPTDPDCKQRALLHGRTYALLTHLQRDPSLPRFNEFALMQAIMAATALTDSPAPTNPGHVHLRPTG